MKNIILSFFLLSSSLTFAAAKEGGSNQRQRTGDKNEPILSEIPEANHSVISKFMDLDSLKYFGQASRQMNNLSNKEECYRHRSLVLNMESVTEENISELVKLLKKIKFITKLKIKNINWTCLSNVLKRLERDFVFPNLQELDLSCNYISSEDFLNINTFLLSRMEKITILHLSNCGIGDEGAREIANSKNMENIKELNLSDNEGIGDEGVRVIAKSEYLKNLIILDFSCNAISSEGAIAIADSENISKLKELNLSFNEIGDQGVITIVNSQNMKNLTILFLWETQIGDVGARAITESEYLKNLIELDISWNSVSDATKDLIYQKFPFAFL